MDLESLRVVLVTWNSRTQIDDCLAALRSSGVDERHVVIVDNASDDGTFGHVATTVPSAVLVQTGRNAGYGAAVNKGLQEIPAECPVLILNPDTRVQPGAIELLLRTAAGRDVGVVSPALVDEDGDRLHSARRDPSWWRTLAEAVLGGGRAGALGIGEFIVPPPVTVTDVDWVTGAALLLTPGARSEVPAWEESYFLYSEEVDYCQRVRDRGFRVVIEPRATVMHRGGELPRSDRLWAIRSLNRVLHAHRRSPPVVARLFHAAALLFELRRALTGQRSAEYALCSVTKVGLLSARDRLLGEEVDAPLATPVAVIVPAYQEGPRIARTLRMLLDEAAEDEFDVVVVVNGSTDETAEAARAVVGDDRVLEVTRPSKTNAIRVGERHLGLPDGRTTIYLDADVGLSTVASRRLVRLVARHDVEAASPTPCYLTTASSLPVRAYLRIWQALPFTRDALAGTGAYVLGPEARMRFGAWPEVESDDAWINAQVPRERRRRAPDAISLVKGPPDTAALLRRRIRVQRGNRALRDTTPGMDSKTTVGDLLRIVLGRPWLLLDLPAFIAITARSRWLERREGSSDWR